MRSCSWPGSGGDGALRVGAGGAAPLFVRLLASLLLSALSYFVFDAQFSALLLYVGSELGDLGVIALSAFFRAGYAEMVSDGVMGVGGGRLYTGLLLGGLIYGVPSTFIVDRLNLYPLFGPLFGWLHEALLGLHASSALRLVLGLLWQALFLDFPRLMLFVVVEGRLAGAEA